MFFPPCVASTAHSASIAAFCSVNRRLSFSQRPQLRPIISNVLALNLSQSSTSNEPLGETPSPPPSQDNNDWFLDGKEAARQLKIDLGIMSDDDDANTNEESSVEEAADESALRAAALERGRAAARALLEDMNSNDSDDDEVGTDPVAVAVVENSSNDKSLTPSDEVETKSEASNNQPPSPVDNQSPKDQYFNLPSRKSHCMTICLVPPPSATKAWEQLTAVRRECKDPGFFRWPPHANIVYPFLEAAYVKDGEESKEVQRAKFRDEVALHLGKAAEKCKPFDVTIDSFGTFGGKQRGVLWAYPKSAYAEAFGEEEEEEEPLIALHSLLEQQFPMCKDQRKGGAFNPHMTVSHYVNNDDALAAKKAVESNWEPVSFHVPEIYLLERKGDDGQFKIAATIPLGTGSEVEIHDTPMPFPAMPEIEEEWVHDERMAMKNRRKNGNNRRRRRGGKGESKERDDTSQESPKQKN